MEKVDISKRTIGINFNEEKASIVLWAPLLKDVSIVFDDHKIDLEKKDYGYWEATTDKILPGTAYKFSLNNKKELPDPASLFQPQSVHEASSAIDLNSYKWSDFNWKNFPLEQYIIYELHTGTFTPEGTFSAIEERLDHLIDLGINAIEIMPVAQFPGGRNWGYDGVFPFAVQNTYGGADCLKKLVETCHKKGLAVILDVVYNHLGPEGNYLGEYGPYFTDKYNTPWGNALNFDDAWCDGVRHFFIENVLMWFRDFHIDALRLDAVHAIKDFSSKHILREIKEHVNLLMAETGRVHYLISELDLNDTKFIDPLEERGFGMDAQWIDEFHHALRVTAGGEKTGYYSDFNGLEHLAKSYKDAYVYDGQFSPHRNKFFGIKADNNPGKQFIVFSQNHDQIGNRMLGERTSTLASFEMQKLLAGAVLVSPFLPMFFMGEEWSEPNPFLYFVSHTDPDLAEAVRKGRKEEFAAFHSVGEAPDPMDEKTFEDSKLQWNLLQEGKHKIMLEYYKNLIKIRKNNPALSVLERKNVQVEHDTNENFLILRRWSNEQQVVVLMNFSKNEVFPSLPHSKEWSILLNSSDEKWLGKGNDVNSKFIMTKIQVQPESIIILTDKA